MPFNPFQHFFQPLDKLDKFSNHNKLANMLSYRNNITIHQNWNKMSKIDQLNFLRHFKKVHMTSQTKSYNSS